MARRRKDSAATITNFRHADATRKNNPPAKIAAEGTVPAIPKAKYRYSPRLDPKLRFDPSAKSDRIRKLIAKAQTEPLSEEEAKLLRDALSEHEPWLEWANKQEEHQLSGGGGFAVDPVALHIHERVSAQAILKVAARQDVERTLFADPQQSYNEAVQFYRYEIDWTNRLILGDSLQVMSSLARREDLAGKVQMIYIDPPYGVKFASNFQPEVGRREVKEREQDLTREPEMVKAYRDTWHLGVHSYLSYLRNRLIVARELLADSGSVFVQISDENIHRVRQLLDEVFGDENCYGVITFQKTTSASGNRLPVVADYLLWYVKDPEKAKYHPLSSEREREGAVNYDYAWFPYGENRRLTQDEAAEWNSIGDGGKVYRRDNLTSQRPAQEGDVRSFPLGGRSYTPRGGTFKTNIDGLNRLHSADRLEAYGVTLAYRRMANDYPFVPINNLWTDTLTGGFVEQRMYVVQTTARVIERCMLMTSDPGDLVLDPTCGSGTTAVVAEQWGRRWITVDTSRVAVSLARQRVMTTAFDRYRIAGEDDPLANGKGVDPSHNFVYKTVPHITLGAIARNESLDPIFAKHQPILEEKLKGCNAALKQVKPELRTKLEKKLLAKQKTEGKRSVTDADQRRWLLPPDNRGTAAERKKKQKDFTVDLESPVWYEWEVPFDADPDWPKALRDAVTEYRTAWRAKMDEVNQCIADNAEQETLVDQPEVVKGVVRVSGPFTVEAVQPPEMSLSDAAPTEVQADAEGMFDGEPGEMQTWEVREVEPLDEMELKNIEAYLDKMIRLMRMDGVRFPNNRQMTFSRLEPIYEGGNSSAFHAEGRWVTAGEKDDDPEGDATVAVVIGPQYGPVTSPLIVDAMRTAFRRGYTDVVFAGFSFDAAAQSEIEEYKDTKVKPHLAHIRPDVNPEMAPLLKEQPGSQLFTVFGLPRISTSSPNEDGEYQVTMEGVDIYNPVDNSIQSTGADKVAAWFLDSDYDGQTFCITQAFFPDRSAWDKLARSLKGVVDKDAFEALSGTTSLPFPPGKHKRVAVKVIDPRGNEVMAVQDIGRASDSPEKSGSRKR